MLVRNVMSAKPPAEVTYQLKQIADTSLTASSTGINLFESNPGVAGALAELNHYGAIIASWVQLSQSATNENLRRVASLNTQWTSTFQHGSIAAHNGRETFANADANWEIYEQYAAYVLATPANELQDMRTWDQ